MSNMNVELYDALKKAGVPEDEARAAAISVLEDNRSLRDEVVALKSDRKVKLEVIFWVAGIVTVFVFLGLLAPEARMWLWPSESGP